MAYRPVFVPDSVGSPFVQEILVEFKWHPGMSTAQAQRSIASLHEAAATSGLAPILDISSKSPERLGVALSAFNLMLKGPDDRSLSVECAFQGSKVFDTGGPFTDLYSATSREAKKDGRIRESGKINHFNWYGEYFPINPSTAFYNWLYIMALDQNPTLAMKVLGFRGFTDIAFNPKRSWNCQARAAALFVGLSAADKAKLAVESREAYLSVLLGEKSSPNANTVQQLSLEL